MNKGKIEQIDTPERIYTRPKTPFVADFMGFENILEGEVLHVEALGEKQLCTVRVGNTNVTVVNSGHLPISVNDQVWIAIRPDSFLLVNPGDYDNNIFPGKVLLHTYRGNNAEYLIDSELGRLSVLESERREYQPGDSVHVFVKPDDCILIHPNEE
jgi:putative spermidine/putrescine transport system ATP-binding protein